MTFGLTWKWRAARKVERDLIYLERQVCFVQAFSLFLSLFRSRCLCCFRITLFNSAWRMFQMGQPHPCAYVCVCVHVGCVCNLAWIAIWQRMHVARTLIYQLKYFGICLNRFVVGVCDSTTSVYTKKIFTSWNSVIWYTEWFIYLLILQI